MRKFNVSDIHFVFGLVVTVVMWVAFFALVKESNANDIINLGLVSAALSAGVPVNMVVDKLKGGRNGNS